VESWANLDFHVDLSGPGGLRQRLTASLREAVRSARLPPGTRLPASRSLATDLGIARNTVAEAYASRASYGAPDWQVDAWVSTYTAVAAGELATVSPDVEQLTGHRATSLADLLVRG